MMQPQNQANQMRAQGQEEEEERKEPLPRYFISEEQAELTHRSLPVMIANRMGHMGQRRIEEGLPANSDIQDLVDELVEHTSQEPDYLLPDTPLKEAIFRVLLANGNRPMNAEEISQVLSERWTMTAYPRDLSPRVIQRLLDHSDSYCIVRAPEQAEAAGQG